MFSGGQQVGGRADWMPLGNIARAHQNERFTAVILDGFGGDQREDYPDRERISWPRHVPTLRSLSFPRWETP